MTVLSIEEAQTNLARVAEQAADARMRALEEERRALGERMRSAEEARLEALRNLGENLRQVDDVIARIPHSDRTWKPILAEARALRADLFDAIRIYAPDEAWFWTEEWQAGEREAEAQMAAGEGIQFASDEEFFAHLDRLTGGDAHA